MKSDSPVSEKQQDLLERYGFAQEIVSGILKTFQSGQPSIAMGINGEWGSGKSSILEFIKQEISIQTSEEKYKTVPFDFNPWIFSGQEDLQRAFLTQLGVKLGAINPALKELGEDLELFASLLEVPNSINPDLTSKTLIGAVLKFFRKVNRKFTKTKTITGLKEKIDEELNNSHIKVFVFIDDIDRLIPSEVMEVLRLVKLNANFKNTFFFLAYDKEVIYKSITSEIKIGGEKFLDKIIQVDYTLPKVTKDTIEGLFVANLDQLSQIHQFTFDKTQISRLWKDGLNGYYTNLRNIYRLINAFSIRYEPIKNDINVIDFIVIESIRLFDFSIYEWLLENKNQLILGRENEIDLLLKKKRTPLHEVIDENLKTNEVNIKKCTRYLILSIFDSLHYPEIHFGEGEIDPLKAEREKRVVHPDYFDHYFTFKVSLQNIPQAVIDSFIAAGDRTKETILDNYHNPLFPVLLTRILFSTKSSQINQDFFKFFLDYSDSRTLEDSNFSKYNRSGMWEVLSLLNDISKQVGHSYFYHELFENPNSFSRFYLLSTLKKRIDKKDDIDPVKDFPDELIIGQETRIEKQHLELLNRISEKYLNAPFEHEIFRINDFLRTLFVYEKQSYQSYIAKYLVEDDTSILLFHCSLTFVGMGGFTSYFIQDEHHILPEMTINIFDERLSKIALDTYLGKKKEILALFYKLKEKGFPKYLSYTIDLKEVRL